MPGRSYGFVAAGDVNYYQHADFSYLQQETDEEILKIVNERDRSSQRARALLTAACGVAAFRKLSNRVTHKISRLTVEELENQPEDDWGYE